MYVIELPEKFTSYTFFNVFLSRIKDYMLKNRNEKLIIDISSTVEFDSIALVHLLVLGTVLKNSSISAELIIGNNSRTKGYLFYIKFFKLAAMNYNNLGSIFKIPNHAYGGFNDVVYKNIPPISLNNKNKSNEFDKHYSPIIKEFYGIIDDNTGLNDRSYAARNKYLAATNVITELLLNIDDHSKSIGYYTIQKAKSNGVFKMCVSDCGQGIYNSIVNKLGVKHKDYEEKNFELQIFTKKQFNKKSAKDESGNYLLAIIEALFHRASDYSLYKMGVNYGLFGVTAHTINSGGVVRIHTGDVQLIINENLWSSTLSETSKIINSIEKMNSSSIQYIDKIDLVNDNEQIKKLIHRYNDEHNTNLKSIDEVKDFEIDILKKKFKEIALNRKEQKYQVTSKRLRFFYSKLAGTHVEIEIYKQYIL